LGDVCVQINSLRAAQTIGSVLISLTLCDLSFNTSNASNLSKDHTATVVAAKLQRQHAATFVSGLELHADGACMKPQLQNNKQQQQQQADP
jgi:hypothetical protein